MTGYAASIPNPALEPLAALIGEWRTSGTLVWSRDEAGFAQTQTFVIEPNRMIATGAMSRDGAEWEGDLSLTYERE